ncbi:MAG: NAD-dependent succinate-semialdehyde dehydrogenase [Pseudomonadota bacterium]
MNMLADFPVALKDPALLEGRAYIDGALRDAAGTFPVHDPATGKLVAEAADCDAAMTREAIDAAYAAQKAWAGLLAAERSALILKMRDLMMEHQDDLGAILCAEMGKPLAAPKGEIAYGASFLEWFAEEGKRLYGDVIPPHAPGKRLVVIKQPVGVVASITPWNFPNAMIARKIAPAFAAGCTVVAKPAEQTPLSATAMAVLADRAGFPPGVFNVLPSNQGPAVGQEMCANPRVRKMTFTGSTEVGRILMRQCADDIKKLSLELGGNAPFIIFDDADLEAAVEGAMASKFRNAGQTCVCANRLYVQRGVYDRVAEMMAEKVGALKVGAGFDEGVTTGPLIDEDGLAKVERHVADALDKGAEAAFGGFKHALGRTFFTPTLLTGATQDMAVASEETFGPVAALIPFDTEEEAVGYANDTEFGLACYFYSRDIGRCWRVAEALEYGIVGVNDGLPSTAVAPFGGVKQSGLGREGSKYGIEDFLEVKYLSLGGV